VVDGCNGILLLQTTICKEARCRVNLVGLVASVHLKNETLRILLVSLCFDYVNVSGYGPQQRVAAGLSTHVFLFRHPQWLSRLNARSPFSPLLSSSSMFLAALTSRFQKFTLHRLLVQRKTFRVNWSTTFMLASLAGAPDEGQFDTALSQSAWIRAPLGQTRLVLVLATPGNQRQERSFSVPSRSVVTRRVMNDVQSCSIVPALVEARTTKGRLGGSDADTLLRTVVTQEM
jgi:hypothetical protein